MVVASRVANLTNKLILTLNRLHGASSTAHKSNACSLLARTLVSSAGLLLLHYGARGDPAKIAGSKFAFFFSRAYLLEFVIANARLCARALHARSASITPLPPKGHCVRA